MTDALKGYLEWFKLQHQLFIKHIVIVIEGFSRPAAIVHLCT